MPFSKHIALRLNAATSHCARLAWRTCIPYSGGQPQGLQVGSLQDSKQQAKSGQINSFPKSIPHVPILGNLKDFSAFPDHEYAIDQDQYQNN